MKELRVLSAHTDPEKNQITLIDEYHISLLREKTTKAELDFADFNTDVLISGLEGKIIIPFDKFIIGKYELEVIKIKDLSLHGQIVPNALIICRGLISGDIKNGEKVEYIPKLFKSLIITLSDRAFKGEYKDRSGPAIREKLSRFFEEKKLPFSIDLEIIPDSPQNLKDLIGNAVKEKYDLIITTGGTGIGKRDITVETVQPLLDKEIPGIMEMIRIKYGSEKPNALLSRGVAGVINNSLIYTLPGSVKAVNEYITEIKKTLYHLFFMLHGIDIH